MKKQDLVSGIVRLPTILLIGAVMSVGMISWAIWSQFYEEKFVTAGLTGIQHLGSNFKIDEFNVDGTDGGNVGWEGGGGSSSCCVKIPRKWRPGLTVMVRWAASNWSKANRSETAAGNYESVSTEGMYRARIPIEKYTEAGDLYVHFFAGGKARVVSTLYSRGIYHPILDSDDRAIEQATTGVPVDQLFTDKEHAEIRRKFNDHVKRYGDWR